MHQILLRAVEPVDLELLYVWENSPEVWAHSDTPAPLSRHVLQQYIEEAQRDVYAAQQLRLMVDLVSADGSRITIGTVDLYDFNPQHSRAGVGVLIFEAALRRQGYATQALQQLMEYAFGTLHLHQLYCTVAESNAASIALFTKLGFEVTGVRREWRWQQQAFESEVFMQRMA